MWEPKKNPICFLKNLEKTQGPQDKTQEPKIGSKTQGVATLKSTRWS